MALGLAAIQNLGSPSSAGLGSRLDIVFKVPQFPFLVFSDEFSAVLARS